MTKDKNLRKVFVKEALGSRKYLSYRTDLVLYKILLSVIVLTAFYFMTDDLLMSLFVAVEVFAVFTLINKMNTDRKSNEGREKLIYRRKKEHFKKKLEEINQDDFEMLIGYLFEKEGWKNYVKKGRHMYLTEKQGIIHCIKIFKMFEEIELEKVDVRSMIEFMGQNNIRTGHLIYTGALSENAAELLEKFKDKLEIKLISIDELYKIVGKYNMLPEDDSFLNKIYEEKYLPDSKEEVKKNIFGNKKMIVYVFAALFFYITSRIMRDSFISRYIFYYFVFLSLLSLIYSIMPEKTNKHS